LEAELAFNIPQTDILIIFARGTGLLSSDGSYLRHLAVLFDRSRRQVSIEEYEV